MILYVLSCIYDKCNHAYEANNNITKLSVIRNVVLYTLNTLVKELINQSFISERVFVVITLLYKNE